MRLRKTSIVLFLITIFFQQLFGQDLGLKVKSSVTYFQQRSAVIELTKNSQWEESTVILSELLEQYQDDSDLYYLMGISAYETGKYQEAVTALVQCLELGGASLSGIPTGSSLSNDIMVKIAMAYGQLKDKSNAIAWLEKAFEARYDEKPFLLGNPAFDDFKDDEEFLALFGISKQVETSRDEAWEADLSYFETRIGQMNYALNHGASSTEIERSIARLKANISTLSDQEVIVEIMKIVGKLGNGHNLIIPTSPKSGALKKLPMQFYQFSDGMFIVDASEDYEQWIGYEIESISGIGIQDALLRSNEVNGRDNDMQTLWLGPYYISLPDVLQGLGIVARTDEVSLGLKDKNGNTQKIAVSPEDWSFSGFPKLPKLRTGDQPMFLSKIETTFWSTLLPEHQAIYIQLNAVSDKSEQTLAAFSEEWFALAKEQHVKYVILDIRHNHGGNGALLPAMHQAIRKFKGTKPEGRLFVLAGRETFSAGQNLLTEITQYADPIIVGEPSGSSPNHIGEAGWVRLPNSGLMAIISTQFHQTSSAEDQRKWIAPHMPVSLSSQDYFSGKDPALEEIIKVIEILEQK